MPTEHEYKYVLSMDFLKEYPEGFLKTFALCLTCKQGSLMVSDHQNLRIRNTIQNEISTWKMTFKHKVSSRLIEVETFINKRDAEDLWKEATHVLRKNRYVIKNGDEKWELDILKDEDNKPYFILLEIELFEDADRPQKVMDMFDKFVIYEVPLNNTEFSNKNLSDIEYAKEKYSQIINKTYKGE